MDVAEKYQQRLQAIAERHRQQEEEKKLRRETKEEWLTTAQKKRKCLREQWLSETTPAPVLPSPDISTPSPPLEDEADNHTAAEQTKSQKTPEDKDEEAADAREKEQEESKVSVNCTATAGSHNNHQADTEEAVQVNKEAEDKFSIQMAQRMFHEEGKDGRSVLGTLAVQVERDPRTGATVVRSVAPLSTPAGAPMTTTVFDDGRKSIHAVSGVGGEPSTEELGQILSVIDGVGLKVLLDEETVTDTNTVPEGQVMSHHTITEEDNAPLESSKWSECETELEMTDCAASMGNEKDKKEDKSIMVVKNFEGEISNMEVQTLKECPVTLLFLGYTDSTPEQDHDQEDYDGMLTVERVMITDEGEEHVIGAASSASPQVGEESQDQVFQDVPLEENGAAGLKFQGEEALPSKAEEGGTSKRKTCQCCSVM